MKRKKFNWSTILFIIIILLFIIPQTRQTFQVWIQKGLSYVNQSTVIEKDDRKSIRYSNWQLHSDSNKTLNFDDTKGKVIFINFWATWCPPCIAEMPSLQALYNDYNEEIVFLFVTNEEFEIVEKFKTKNDFNFEVFNPLSKVPSELSTRGIPRTFIINKSGEIVIDETGALNWNSEKVRGQLDALLLE